MSVGISAWKCGRCDTWNDIRDVHCKKCAGKYDTWNIAHQYHNVLTPEEERFYHGTAIEILKELREIRNMLARTVGGSHDNQRKS